MVRRKEGHGILDGAEHFVLRFAYAHSADGIAIEAYLHQRPGALLAKVGM